MYKELDARVNAVMEKMTLKEKIGQLNQLRQPSTPEEIEKANELIRQGLVGSIIQASSAHAGNDKEKAVKVDLFNSYQKVAVEESVNHIPLIFGRDVIHGHHTVYPIPLASASAYNPELVEKCYGCIAEEAAADNIHWTFSPMVDLCHDPRWGRMVEGPGEDPYVGAQFARAAVKGFQGDDMSDGKHLAACAKHYLGYGFSEGGRDYFRTEISGYTLYNYVVPAFRAAVEAGVATVMSSFNDINGESISRSRYYLTDLLRDKLGFEGFVVSDWESIDQMVAQGNAEDSRECAQLSIHAGIDMDMVSLDYLTHLESLVEEGKVDVKDIDEACRRILRIKFARGLFDHPYCELKSVDRTEHLKLARDLAAESMILLKNEGNILPLKKNQTIALCGPFVRERQALFGTWTLDGNPALTPSFLEAMTAAVEGHGGKILTGGENMLLEDYNMKFYDSDVVVLALGEHQAVSGEARSLADISLTAPQVRMAQKAHESGKKVVGVIFCGRPVSLQNVEPYMDAILCAWHTGSEAAGAASDLLFGDRVPCGKTPATFLRTSQHVPLYYNVTKSGRTVNGYYGDHPQLNYVDSPAAPLYPFGYGLSYTTFSYSEVTADRCEISLEELKNGKTLTVSATVKNTGDCTGKEIAELYIRDVVATRMRPIREMKGFKKDEYRPGEEKVVSFSLGYKDLGYYLEDGSYLVEPGKFEVYIGENCLTKNKIDIVVR